MKKRIAATLLTGILTLTMLAGCAQGLRADGDKRHYAGSAAGWIHCGGGREYGCTGLFRH